MKKELSLEEKKKILVSILSEVHNFCDENNLKYFLTGGTLIGAVRHKGFIPWDDDIDIYMPRNDYEKFLCEFNKESKRYQVISLKTDGYYLPFGKVIDTKTVLIENVDSDYKMGIYLDIFPLDNLSSNYNEALSLYKAVSFYRKLLAIKNAASDSKRKPYMNFLLKVGKVVIMPVSRKWILCQIDMLSQKYREDTSSQYIGAICAAFYGEKEILRSDWFTERCLLEFEGGKFWAPKDYDAFLTQLYGDYTQLPPEEKRVTHHDNKAWLVED